VVTSSAAGGGGCGEGTAVDADAVAATLQQMSVQSRAVSERGAAA